jgi:cytochrome c oxidase assembly protein subunit 11
MTEQRSRNRQLGFAIVLVIAGMIGISYAAVPLYRAFCQATGYGGTPDITGNHSPGMAAQRVTVRFDADVSPGLPWRFAPQVDSVSVQLGEEKLAFYNAQNLASRPITGVALYNVTPEKIGKYFHKTACFCFNQQVLAPGQKMEFPLTFWVDPAIATDPATADVHTITLSYTFFQSMKDAAAAGALAKAGPHVGPLETAPTQASVPR